MYSQCSRRPTNEGTLSNVTAPIARYNSGMVWWIRHHHCTGRIDSILVRWPSRTMWTGWWQTKWNGWLPYCCSTPNALGLICLINIFKLFILRCVSCLLSVRKNLNSNLKWFFHNLAVKFTVWNARTTYGTMRQYSFFHFPNNAVWIVVCSFYENIRNANQSHSIRRKISSQFELFAN